MNEKLLDIVKRIILTLNVLTDPSKTIGNGKNP